MAAARDFDIVVFGATGFTGELTAAYLAAIPPADLIMAMGMLHGLRKRVQRQRRTPSMQGGRQK